MITLLIFFAAETTTDFKIPFSIRVVCGVLGFLFLYMSSFIYENKLGELQNRLVEIWVRINAQHETFLGRQSAIIKSSARIAESALRWLFGERLISIQVVVLSSALSVSSLAIMLVYGISRPMEDSATDIFLGQMVFLLAAVIFIAYSLFAARVLFKRRSHFAAIALFVLLLLLLILALAYGHDTTWPEHFITTAAYWESVVGIAFAAIMALMVGLTCDLTLLIGSRAIFRLAANSQSVVRIFLTASFSAFWFLLLVDSMRVVFVDQSEALNSHDPYLKGLALLILGPSGSDDLWRMGLGLGFATNIFNCIAAASLFLVFFVLLLHRLFWPFISQLIYALYKWKILANTTLQLSAAGIFLSIAFPWIAAVLKLFHAG
jgi:hypothetical protein